MTTAEAMKLIGTYGWWNCGDGVEVEVCIVDVKESWGRTRYCIEPRAGRGRRWVETIKFGA